RYPEEIGRLFRRLGFHRRLRSPGTARKVVISKSAACRARRPQQGLLEHQPDSRLQSVAAFPERDSSMGIVPLAGKESPAIAHPAPPRTARLFQVLSAALEAGQLFRKAGEL